MITRDSIIREMLEKAASNYQEQIKNIQAVCEHNNFGSSIDLSNPQNGGIHCLACGYFVSYKDVHLYADKTINDVPVKEAFHNLINNKS